MKLIEIIVGHNTYYVRINYSVHLKWALTSISHVIVWFNDDRNNFLDYHASVDQLLKNNFTSWGIQFCRFCEWWRFLKLNTHEKFQSYTNSSNIATKNE